MNMGFVGQDPGSFLKINPSGAPRKIGAREISRPKNRHEPAGEGEMRVPVLMVIAYAVGIILAIYVIAKDIH